MRIAFVGKGGSGKSTLAASFASYVSSKTLSRVVVFDADINIHTPSLLGFETIAFDRHLSNPHVSELIKKWLIGGNDIKSLPAFRKTTPPTRKSNIFKVKSTIDSPIEPFGTHKGNLSVFAVGTYQEEDIGASCYHNNLAILENILSHTDDLEGYVIVDMVAGVDSFAGTLHAQFDQTCLIVEPTLRSIEVYSKYIQLAAEAGIAESVKVVGNKVRSDKDIEFIRSHIPESRILGYFLYDEHICNIDQGYENLSVEKLNLNNQNLLKEILTATSLLPDNRDNRLKKIWELHKKYVSQGYIKERFGSLTEQIDPEFAFTDFTKPTNI